MKEIIKTLNQLANEHFSKDFRDIDLSQKQVIVSIQANNIAMAQLEIAELKFLDKIL